MHAAPLAPPGAAAIVARRDQQTDRGAGLQGQRRQVPALRDTAHLAAGKLGGSGLLARPGAWRSGVQRHGGGWIGAVGALILQFDLGQGQIVLHRGAEGDLGTGRDEQFDGRLLQRNARRLVRHGVDLPAVAGGPRHGLLVGQFEPVGAGLLDQQLTARTRRLQARGRDLFGRQAASVVEAQRGRAERLVGCGRELQPRSDQGPDRPAGSHFRPAGILGRKQSNPKLHHPRRFDDLHVDPGHAAIVAAFDAIGERPRQVLAAREDGIAQRTHDLRFQAQAALGPFEAVPDTDLGWKARALGVDHFDLERLAARHAFHASPQFEVRDLRPARIAKRMDQPRQGNSGRLRLHRRNGDRHQPHGRCGKQSLRGGPTVKDLAEIQPFDCGRGLADRGLPQRGRSRPGVSILFGVQKLHGAGQTIAQRVEMPFHAKGQFHIVHTHQAQAIQVAVSSPGQPANGRQRTDQTESGIVVAKDLVQKPQGQQSDQPHGQRTPHPLQQQQPPHARSQPSQLSLERGHSWVLSLGGLRFFLSSGFGHFTPFPSLSLRSIPRLAGGTAAASAANGSTTDAAARTRWAPAGLRASPPRAARSWPGYSSVP